MVKRDSDVDVSVQGMFSNVLCYFSISKKNEVNEIFYQIKEQEIPEEHQRPRLKL